MPQHKHAFHQHYLCKNPTLSLNIRCDSYVISAFCLNISLLSVILEYEICFGPRDSGTVGSLQTPNMHNKNSLHALQNIHRWTAARLSK